MPVVRAHWRDRTIAWHAHALNQLLYELAEPDALVRGIRELIQMSDPPGEPVVIHKGEAASWFQYGKKKIRGIISPNTERRTRLPVSRETAPSWKP